ncbi:unnamed protein product [Macrosiphum euphorbiae]|uniref:Uncharacterized protein n=1 Tax=Macrosiphum euphorbiae TaxID=13131 RepID=A0AAV0WSC6_9HEMI|nr:unnamed protein product [Macrosiphum euphorbiae]
MRSVPNNSSRFQCARSRCSTKAWFRNSRRTRNKPPRLLRSNILLFPYDMCAPRPSTDHIISEHRQLRSTNTTIIHWNVASLPVAALSDEVSNDWPKLRLTGILDSALFRTVGHLRIP